MPVPIVTIFGGSGFIGRYVAQRMARAGWRVRVAVRRPNEAHFVRPYGFVGQVEPIQANIRDEDSTRRVIRGADAVVNCVGVLAESDGVLSSLVAERAQLDRARTSRAISSLASKKLVSRTVLPGDRRQVEIALTEEGRALYRALFPLVRQINRDLLSPLSADEVGTLDAALARVQAQAQAMVAAADLPKADRRRGGRGRAPG